MDIKNLNKWWYGLPQNTRQVIGGNETWEALDISVRLALYQYSLLRIAGAANDRDEERPLLNEIACGLGDLALVRKNGTALEDMCNENGEFQEEYQEQFDRFYDSYQYRIENISWKDWLGDTALTNSELVKSLKHHGYRRVDIDADRRIPGTFYTFRGGLHINGTENLSFHIVPPQESLGLGRFAICATRNGESSQLGTDHAPFFFRRLFAFLKGERKEKEIIDEICTDRRTE